MPAYAADTGGVIMQDEYFNTGEAAAVVKLSASTLNKLRMKGSGPGYLKLGRRVVYSRRSLDEWMSSRVRTSTSDAGPEPARATPSYAPAAAAPPVARFAPDWTPPRPRQM
jgi:predicted DNA-binding transcriptional regulator AlpA